MSEHASMVGAMRRSEPASAHGDELEAGLNALIERRAANAEHADDPQAREESWKASERAYRAERQESLRHQWRAYYQRLSALHRRISEDLQERADAL